VLQVENQGDADSAEDEDSRMVVLTQPGLVSHTANPYLAVALTQTGLVSRTFTILATFGGGRGRLGPSVANR
jgi:hypothetical protein